MSTIETKTAPEKLVIEEVFLEECKRDLGLNPYKSCPYCRSDEIEELSHKERKYHCYDCDRNYSVNNAAIRGRE